MSLHLDHLKTFSEVSVGGIWGEELLFVNTPLYSAKLLIINESYAQSSLHYHNRKDETLIVLEGEVMFELGVSGKTLRRTGGRVNIYPGLRHRFWTELGGTAIVLEIATHFDKDDIVVVEPGRFTEAEDV